VPSIDRWRGSWSKRVSRSKTTERFVSRSLRARVKKHFPPHGLKERAGRSFSPIERRNQKLSQSFTPISAISAMTKPTIAANPRYCVGGGMEMRSPVTCASR